MLEEKINLLKKISAVGLTSLVLSGCEDSYGCFDDINCVSKGNSYECTLDGRFYGHPTGVNISAGQFIQGQASGIVDWWGDKQNYSNGPDNVPNYTRGLGIGIGENSSYSNSPQMYFTDYAGSDFTLEAPVSGEIYFMIPDGPGSGVCGGEGTYWSDNDGEFSVTFNIE